MFSCDFRRKDAQLSIRADTEYLISSGSFRCGADKMRLGDDIPFATLIAGRRDRLNVPQVFAAITWLVSAKANSRSHQVCGFASFNRGEGPHRAIDSGALDLESTRNLCRGQRSHPTAELADTS
jgi:hypothetical protein